jgi:hypothetical protein
MAIVVPSKEVCLETYADRAKQVTCSWLISRIWDGIAK